MLDARKLAEDGDVLHLTRWKGFRAEPKHLYVRAAGGDPTKQQADSEYHRSWAMHWLSPPLQADSISLPGPQGRRPDGLALLGKTGTGRGWRETTGILDGRRGNR